MWFWLAGCAPALNNPLNNPLRPLVCAQSSAPSMARKPAPLSGPSAPRPLAPLAKRHKPTPGSGAQQAKMDMFMPQRQL